MIIWWWSLRYDDDGNDDDDNDGVVVDDNNDDDDDDDGDDYLCFWIGMSGILFNAEYMALWTKASDKDLVICCTSALLLYAET